MLVSKSQLLPLPPPATLRLSPKQAVESVEDALDQLLKVQGRIATSVVKLAKSADADFKDPLDSKNLILIDSLDFVAARMCNPMFQLRAHKKMLSRQSRIMKLHDDVAELKAHFDSHKELDDGHPVRSRSPTSKSVLHKQKACSADLCIAVILLRQLKSLKQHLRDIEKECPTDI